jgi:hypothetical protein
MTTPPLPIPPAVKRTILRCIENEEYDWGKHSDLNEARQWLAELERQWPTLACVPNGKDIFAGEYPVSGE